jgi:hypothetical protein
MSQKLSWSKRSKLAPKVQVSLTINDDTNTELENLALSRRLPKSTVAEEMLRRGIQASATLEKKQTRRSRVA